MNPQVLVERFRRYYGNVDFRDACFTDDECAYKRQRGQQMREWLSHDALRQLVEQEDWAEICQRVAQSFTMKGSLARWNEYQWVNALDGAEQRQFAQAFVEFLYGDAPFLERLERFVAQASEVYRHFLERDPVHRKRYIAQKLSWPFVSYFHFMMWPEQEYVFVKPDPLREAAELAGFDLQYKSQPNPVTYARVQEFYRQLWPTVQRMGGRDWIDVQTLIYVAGGGFGNQSIEVTQVVEAGNFTGFSEDTFRFLQELEANNSDEWMHRDYNANEMRYRRVLREPLRELLRAVGPTVKALDPAFETEAKYGKVLAVIKKRWPDEEGPYHPYYWGAFYRQGRTKQTDAQLFVNVHPTHVNVGFSVAGAQAADVLNRFRHNLKQAPQVFLALLQALPPDIHVRTCEHHGMKGEIILSVQTLDDVQQLLEPALIDIERRYPADDPILFQPEFVAEVAALFRALYPIYRFAVTDDPDELAGLLPAVEEEEEGEEERRLTLADVSAETYLSEAFLGEMVALLEDKKQIVLYGPPGTGKTFVARHLARYWIDAAPDAGGEMQVVQFHPSYAYEEFVEGIRPQSVEGADGRRELSYPVRKGLFRRFCDEARSHSQRHYVLLLDEINRGELPRILGELLYLLEYREQVVTLPYSGESFAIPPNLYLIGTMNTADRSIALVDHALRRRFHFVPLKPDPKIVRAYFERRGRPGMTWVADLLDTLNRKLEQDGVEWHQHIGHSHFMRPDLDEKWLRLIWTHSILPTLEEYFYRQPEILQSYSLDALREELA